MLLETHLRRQCLLKTCLPPHTYILFNKYAGGRLVQRFPREIRCKRHGHFTATPGSYTEVEIPFE
jgi:hypothetical protein